MATETNLIVSLARATYEELKRLDALYLYPTLSCVPQENTTPVPGKEGGPMEWTTDKLVAVIKESE